MNNKYYLTRKRKYEMEYRVKKKHTKLHNKFSFHFLEMKIYYVILYVFFLFKTLYSISYFLFSC